MRIACYLAVAEELFLEKVDEESSSSAWYCTEVLEVQKEPGEAGKHDGFVLCHAVESNSKA